MERNEAPYQPHSETSRAAAEAIAPAMPGLRARVLAVLRERGPLTDEEIQDVLGMNPSTERPRRVELHRARLIRIVGKRKTRSGRMAALWAVFWTAPWRISHRLWGIVLLLANSGMRRGEALNLQWKGEWSEVNLDTKMITLKPSRWWRPKDKRPRHIPIDGILFEFLKVNHGRFPYVVTSRKGERYRFWPQKLFDEARTAAGLSGGPHRLRHSFASHFLRNWSGGGDAMFVLAKVLGHSHARITKIYSHLLPDHLEEARGVVNFGGASEGKARAHWTTPRGRRPKKTTPVTQPQSASPASAAEQPEPVRAAAPRC